MSLHNHIILSQKHQKKIRVFPWFFTPVLNEFYFLKDEYGFRKPRLDAWGGEASIEFTSKDIGIIIEYGWPNYIGIYFTKTNVPGKIYINELFERLNIVFEKKLLKVQESKDTREIESQITSHFQTLSAIVKEHFGKIVEYLGAANSFV